MAIASRWRRALLPLLAAGGTTAGHWLAYVAASAPHKHSALLQETGHGSEGLLGLSLRALIAALFIASAQSVVISRGGNKRLSLFARLASLQVFAFAALEASERTGAQSSGLGELLLEPVFLAGLLTQILVAGCIFLAARAVARAITRLLDLYTPNQESDSATAHFVRTSTRAPLLPLPAAGWTLRGPPPVL